MAPELKDGIRVTDAEFTWNLKAKGEGTEVTYEGYSDPAGSIPDWLANSAVVDSPFYSLRELRAQF